MLLCPVVFIVRVLLNSLPMVVVVLNAPFKLLSLNSFVILRINRRTEEHKRKQ
jgi:hypothetical protein